MRIVMDDAGDVPQEQVDELEIIVVPVNIAFGTEEFLSGITKDHASFYEKTKKACSENFPKTQKSTPFQYDEVNLKLFSEGESEILTITVGEKLSGTYASAEAAAKELEGQGSLYLFDSMGGSPAQG